MKKVLCDKDGKFLSVHEKNETFVELKDGDYLTHEDGCILIYKEYECKENISEISYHVYLRNNKLHFPQTEMSFSYYDFIPSYRFSAEEEKKRMNNALAEKGLFYNIKSKCIEKFGGVPRRATCIITLISMDPIPFAWLPVQKHSII